MTALALPIRNQDFTADHQDSWSFGDAIVIPFPMAHRADTSERDRLPRLRRGRKRMTLRDLEDAYARAAADPGFVNEMAEISDDFASTVADGLEDE